MEDPNRSELEMDVAQMDHSGRPIGTWLCCLPCDWLKKNNSFHKMFLTVATLLVTVLLVASPVLFLISSIPGEKSRDCQYQGGGGCVGKGNEKVCLGEQCLIAANRILASMSWKTNPCHDFYHFACGSWKRKSEKTESKFPEHLYINFDTLQENVDLTIQQLLANAENSDPFQKLGTFYKSCLQAGDKRISFLPMLTLLDDLGGYIEPDKEPTQDLTDLVLSLLKINGAPLFDIYLDVDPSNSSKSAPIVDLPLRFGHNFASKYWWYRTGKNLINEFGDESAFKQMFVTSHHLNKAYTFIKATIEEKRLILMERIMQEFMYGNMSMEEKIKETQNTLLLANSITKAYPLEKDVAKNYQREKDVKMKLRDVQQKYPFIRWKFILEELFNINLTLDDQIFILPPAYLDRIQKILERFSPRVTHNGLLLIFATDTLYELLNASSTQDWPGFCTKMTVNLFSTAVSILYVRQYGMEYIDHLRLRVRQIFMSLKSTFERRIRNAPWLDDKTRIAALQKLATLRGQFLTWPNFWNSTYASSLMESVQVDPENFFGNVILRYKQLRKSSVNFMHYQPEEKRWAYPFVVNAFYVLSMNAVIIPLAVLTQPYFKEDVPLYVPYSTIGLVLAHEILHGFDLRGIEYNSKGKPEPLLSSESKTRLEARLDCFVKQFSSTFWKKVNFLGSNIDVQFDWNMTKNENMADISGLQIAYQAWKSNTKPGLEPRLPGVALNAQQLFFLNAAQTYCSRLSPADYIFLVETDSHTPHPERVNGIMMNSPSFAETFSCPLGSPMNPKKKCSTW